MTTEARPLAADFEPGTHDAWVKLVEKALKGGDFEKRMVSHSADGLRILPLYGRAGDKPRVTRTETERPWRICQRVDHPDAHVASQLILDDLQGGSDAIAIVPHGSRAARGFGLTAQTVSDLDAALAGVALDMITVRLEPAHGGRANAAMLAALITQRGHTPSECAVDFGLDPIGTMTATGVMSAPWAAISKRLGDAVVALKAQGFTGPFLTCDVRGYHEAGASEVQELAIALATGVAYLRALSDTGLDIDDAARALSWTIAVDADQFLGIAKLRALRRLWARVEEASGLTPRPIKIHAESAWRMLTQRDPWVNMLRGTMATFTAGIAGADTITVLPHTAALGLPDGFARRIARNTHLILQEESNIWRVADPAAGSGAYEGLTDELAQAAWTLFQEIEAEGGIVESLVAGKIHDRIAQVREKRASDIATRRAAVTGTSEFPLLNEAPVKVLDVEPRATTPPTALREGDSELTFAELISTFKEHATRSKVVQAEVGATTATPLPCVRLSEPFEALRDASDRYLSEKGQRPQIFVAALGAIAEHTARSSWIRNLMGSGGIEALISDGYANANEAAEAFAASGARLACISSSDAKYADMGETVAKALKAQGASHVYMAGRPGEQSAALEAAGVDAFIYAGQDVLSLLRKLHDHLGIPTQ
ncbi:methylmalonyl-CoA mutase family protein [Filomicrobium sp.]|uniref:methylmalonyl-CoA mutase family protein n=1 Tax=Filomicrobium sp. TaxID=2024831 RepID=UPI002582B22F|nr:methylmalonyl-CoA mutase family protein [Filomicrobium sp.]MCV0369894.1 methylmalonyl-CoA mutase subunit beta [Filomicrobium sp.]